MKLYIGSKDVVVRNRSIYTDTKLYFPMYKMKIITVTNMRPSYSTAYHALPDCLKLPQLEILKVFLIKIPPNTKTFFAPNDPIQREM